MKYYSDLITHGKPGRMRTDADKRYIIMFSIPDSTQGVIIHESYGHEPALNLTKALADFLDVEAKIYDKVI
jgi:aromatic ring hydroxylase